ncbi:CU044_5270 family protein [Lentzea rhizosphaerae]|uniref:CU044_5270 family protein n=1 Tax=Lentzea rhizosphaerae TaxID=2041025 RepID=A0ABV8BN40_9PSEU
MRDETRQVEDETVKWAMADVAPMSDEAFERGRVALLARIDAEESGKVVPLRRRRRIPLVAAAAAMVVIAGAALLAPSLVSQDKGPNVAAADVLEQAANLTGDAKLQPGQYLHVLQKATWSMTDYDHRWMYLQGQTSQTWIPADRKGTWLYRHTRAGGRQWLIGSEKDLPAGFESPIDSEGEYTSEGGPALHDKIEASFRDPSPEYLATLPLDPRELYRKLRDEVSGNEGLVFLQMINDGLDSGVYPAAVRSAVYQALTYLPKLEVVDQAATIGGRTGTALGVTENETTEQIVVDQATGEYLGSRTLLAKDAWGLKKGQVIGVSSVTTTVVSGAGQGS